MTEIELRNVSTSDKGNQLLKNVSMKIESGEYISLLGPTGSGPSYILKVISGLQDIDEGQILIDGKDVSDTPPEDREVGVVFEQFNLFPHMTVLENVLYGPKMRQEDLGEKTKVAKEILSMVRLDGRENALTKELSGGMQQRTGIARAITAGAKILLLDQPYRALDAKIREEMRFEIRELVKDLGLTAIHSTHETEEAMDTADRIAVFENGRLLQIDTPKDIFRYPTSISVANFLAEGNEYVGHIENGNLNINGLKFETNHKNAGEVKVVIRHQAVVMHRDEKSGTNIIPGRVVKIRLLGEFIRFKIEISDNFSITCRELLSLKHINFSELQDQEVYIEIPPSVILIYPKN